MQFNAADILGCTLYRVETNAFREIFGIDAVNVRGSRDKV